MINSQNQKAGDNSQQFQATQMVVNVGIDEKRAREIYQEMNLQLRKDYSNEAFEIAISRVSEFESKLMSKMEKVEGALDVFADPSFQLLLVEAQKTAAATERPADYDLLSELLIHRFKAGENRTTRAGINRAVEIVDEISDDALLGITIYHTVISIVPTTHDILQGLDTLDNLFSKIFYCDLPTGNEWLDHLEILNAIRINNLMKLNNLETIYSTTLSEYIDLGIAKTSANFDEAQKIIQENNIPQNILVENPLNNDFVRVAVSKKMIDTLSMTINNGSFSQSIPFSLDQKNAVEKLYQLYDQDPEQKQKNCSIFMEELNKRPNLKKLRDWWDKIEINFTLTSVGSVLAHSNLQRCDNKVPNFR
ncbi:LPO_1073/Vpar_1526 family protein [Acinetobacter sp. Brlt_5]|uniref:LPO_1073/Vpar_1526 family protein n=1 Tax=Acinetobacter sp. Brlt_5 TaxID=3110915 RepID=UPI003F7C9F3F